MKSSSVMSSFTLASMLAMMCLSSNALAKSTKSKQPAPNPAQASVQGAPLTAETWEFRIREEDSIFSIVTLKKGIASGLAHNHLIAATRYQAQLKANPKELEKGTFTFSTKVSDLEVDRADLQKRWFPTIKSLSWLTEPFRNSKILTVKPSANTCSHLISSMRKIFQKSAQKLLTLPHLNHKSVVKSMHKRQMWLSQSSEKRSLAHSRPTLRSTVKS